MKELRKYSLKLFSKLVLKADLLVKGKKYNKALSLLKVATWIQYVYSNVFTDNDIEKLLKVISGQIHSHYYPSNTYILYDDFAIDNLGLTQQYLKALIFSQNKIIYITSKPLDGPNSIDIYNEVKSAKNIEHVYYIKTGNPFDDAKGINRLISSYKPQKIFMHLQPNSVEAIVAVCALPRQTQKYMIDIQDHAYWVGSSIVDYDIVFRSYGYNIAEHFRGIDKKRILFQPYYPIFNRERNFEGLPDDINGKLIIISGGAYHKVFSHDNIFQNFVIKVLEENPNVVYVFAGDGNLSIFNSITKLKKFKNRFFLLGQRKDIFQVLEHSDIYINTFPFGGGLMAQLAAYSKLPIMSFDYPGTGGELESVLCQKHYIKITHDSLDSMYKQLVEFINNKEARIEFGKNINKCLIDDSWFNKNFNKILLTNKSDLQCESFANQFFEKEMNHNRIMQVEQEFYIWIFQHLGWKSIMYCPKLSINLVLSFCNYSGLKRGLKKIKKEIVKAIKNE